MVKSTLGFLFKILFRAIVAIVLFVAIVLIIFNFPVEGKNEQMEFGVSFANIQARALDLDWKETYLAILNDLRPKRIRLAAYWDEIEKEEGEFDFSDLDWQIEEARKHDTEVILAFGIKAPRWPECHIPLWHENDKAKREEALLLYEKLLIERYKKYENIVIWQVENEPFLPFGDCIPGAVDGDLVDREVEQVKELDSTRPVMVTDSGELSIWYRAAKRGDVFGTTLYRVIYKEPYGYVKYPVGPAFFRLKGWFIKQFANQHDIMISELQAEPWGPGWLPHLTIEEQYKSMNPEKFEDIIEYAQKTNFSEAHLWGVEWWYWLKTTQKRDEMWETAKKAITQRQ